MSFLCLLWNFSNFAHFDTKNSGTVKILFSLGLGYLKLIQYTPLLVSIFIKQQEIKISQKLNLSIFIQHFKKLILQIGIFFEFTKRHDGRGICIRFSDSTHRHAQMICLNQNHNAARI